MKNKMSTSTLWLRLINEQTGKPNSGKGIPSRYYQCSLCNRLTRKKRLDNHKERRGNHGEQHDVDEDFEPLITLHE